MRISAGAAAFIFLLTLPTCDSSRHEAESDRSTTSTYARTAAPCDPSAGHIQGNVVEISLNPDGASPRCVRPRKNEKFRIVNPTAGDVTVSLDGRSGTVPPGGSYTFPDVTGDWLGQGNHCLETSLYPGSCVEVYVDNGK